MVLCAVLSFPVYRHYLGCTSSPGGSIVQVRSINEFRPGRFGQLFQKPLGLQLMMPCDSALLVAAVQGP